MKSLTNLNKSYFRALVWLVCGLALGGMSSCDRLTDLQGKAMDLFENVSEKTESGMSSVDEKEAKAIIADESRLVLVEFYSDTWGPCKTVAPVLERLAETNSEKVKIIKVDVTQEREWATQEKIRGVPTFQFYRGGKKITQFSGAPPEAVLQQKIDQHSSSKQPSTNGQVAPNEADAAAEAGEKVQPVIQHMPKNWLPPGVTRQ